LAGQRDEFGNPYTLVYYNMAYGTSYIVEVSNITPKEDFGSGNMIWNYTLNMIGVAPASDVLGFNYLKSLVTLTAISLIDDGIMATNKITNDLLNRINVNELKNLKNKGTGKKLDRNNNSFYGKR
jgi:hypothetical protein